MDNCINSNEIFVHYKKVYSSFCSECLRSLKSTIKKWLKNKEKKITFD